MFGWYQNPTSGGLWKQERNENGHRMTATALLMKFPSPSARVTHFLFLSFFFLSHPPLADTAAPNSSQRSICMNLIKKDWSYWGGLLCSPDPLVLGFLAGEKVEAGSVLIFLGKMSPWKWSITITQMNFNFKGHSKIKIGLCVLYYLHKCSSLGLCRIKKKCILTCFQMLLICSYTGVLPLLRFRSKSILGLVQIANPCEITGDFVKYPAITKFPGATDYTAFRHPL